MSLFRASYSRGHPLPPARVSLSPRWFPWNVGQSMRVGRIYASGTTHLAEHFVRVGHQIVSLEAERPCYFLFRR
jgi:hypothetical protein